MEGRCRRGRKDDDKRYRMSAFKANIFMQTKFDASFPFCYNNTEHIVQCRRILMFSRLYNNNIVIGAIAIYIGTERQLK